MLSNLLLVHCAVSLLIVFSIDVAYVTADKSIGEIHWEYNERNYNIYSFNATFETAESICRSHKATLPQVNSKEDMIKMKRIYSSSFLVGHKYNETSRSWYNYDSRGDHTFNEYLNNTDYLANPTQKYNCSQCCLSVNKYDDVEPFRVKNCSKMYIRAIFCATPTKYSMESLYNKVKSLQAQMEGPSYFMTIFVSFAVILLTILAISLVYKVTLLYRSGASIHPRNMRTILEHLR